MRFPNIGPSILEHDRFFETQRRYYEFSTPLELLSKTLRLRSGLDRLYFEANPMLISRLRSKCQRHPSTLRLRSVEPSLRACSRHLTRLCT